MIYFDAVSKRYKNGAIALHDVRLNIEQGEFVTIIGPSGAGKSTLLKMIIGEEEPTSGSITIDEYDVSKLSHHRLLALRRRIGYVFQDYKLLDSRTVKENIQFILEVMGRSSKEIDADVYHALRLVGLQEKSNVYPGELSMGERQRVAIARALVGQPELLLADEPTGNLDPAATYDIVSILKRIHELGTTVVLTTHSKSVVDSLQKRVVTLDRGRIVKDESRGMYSLPRKQTAQ